MPKEAVNEKPFECPFCHTIVIVKDPRGWRKYVYRDLQPYVCTFIDCTTQHETYESRRQWFNHELQKHRRIWACSGHCQQTFHSSTQLISHLKNSAPINITDAQLPALIETRAIPIPRNAESSCPLCKVRVVGISSLQKHLGRHLEELALFALPNDAVESDDDAETTPSDNEHQKGAPDMLLENRIKDVERASATSREVDAIDTQFENLSRNLSLPNLVDISEDEVDTRDIEMLIAKQREKELLMPLPLGDIFDEESPSSPLERSIQNHKEEPLHVSAYLGDALKEEKDSTSLGKDNMEQRYEKLVAEKEASKDQKGDAIPICSGEGMTPEKSVNSMAFKRKMYEIVDFHPAPRASSNVNETVFLEDEAITESWNKLKEERSKNQENVGKKPKEKSPPKAEPELQFNSNNTITPFYQGWTFTILDPETPEEKKTWTRALKSEMPVSHTDLESQIQRQREKGITVISQCHKLNRLQRAQIDRLVEEKNKAEKDKRLE